MSKSHLKKILHGNECSNSSYFEWRYVGELSNGHHIIWSNIDESLYCFCGFHILKEENGNLFVTDTIDGCRGSEILDGEIKGNQVIFHQITTSAGLLETAARLSPEFKRYYDRSSKEGTGSGKTCYTGYSKYSTWITEEGKAEEPIFISFYPCEGWPPYSHKVYQREDITKLAFEVLADIDGEKPEELKERGIAYSPVCFRKLLEDDLKGINLETTSVSISALKNAPYNRFESHNYFTWKYVGQFERYHVIYTTLTIGDYGHQNHFSGIYTIVKEGDLLKKVARLARTEGEENNIVGGVYSDFNPYLFELENHSLVYQQNVSHESLMKKLEHEMGLSSWCEGAYPGILKIKVQIDNNGSLKQREIMGFQSTAPNKN